MEGRIDARLVERVATQTRRWLEPGHAFQSCVIEIDSGAGEAEAARELSAFILVDLRGLRTIAFIPPGKKALGAAALVALSAKDIVLGPESRLGAAGEPVPELRDAFRGAAERWGRSTLLAEAMATGEHEDIHRVRFAQGGAQAGPEKVELMTTRDMETLPPARKVLRRGEPERVLAKGDLLTLDPRAARDHGIANHIANDKTELLHETGILIPPENIIDSSRGALRSRNSGGQALIDFLNRPFPRFLLLLCGSLALLLEVKMLGTMVPGAIALFCFAIFFGTSLLPATGSMDGNGTATLFEVLLFILGLGLLALEFFLLPGTAIFALMGGALCAISIVLAMVSSDGSSESLDIKSAIGILAFGFGAGAISFLCILRFLPTNPLFSRRGLVSHSAIVGVPTADSALEAQTEALTILGRSGRAVTSLRPAGKVELEDGRLLDVVAEGEFIEVGTPIKVIQCEGARIVVTRGG